MSAAVDAPSREDLRREIDRALDTADVSELVAVRMTDSDGLGEIAFRLVLTAQAQAKATCLIGHEDWRDLVHRLTWRCLRSLAKAGVQHAGELDRRVSPRSL